MPSPPFVLIVIIESCEGTWQATALRERSYLALDGYAIE